MTVGIVKWFDVEKGCGFIQPVDGGRDVFVHITAVQRSGMDSLIEGQKLSYELAPHRNGKMIAHNLKPA